jgi:hypothetical protein
MMAQSYFAGVVKIGCFNMLTRRESRICSDRENKER